MLPRSHLPSVCSISARPLFAAVGGVVLLFGSACAAADVEDREVSLDPAPDEAAASLPDDEPALVAIGPGSGPILDGESDEAAEVEPVKPDETPPGLVVLSVAPGPLAEDSHVVFKGFSEPGTTVTAGEATTVTGDDGRWYLELAIEEGEDTVVTSTDAAGNEIEKEVTATFEEPEPKPVVYEQPREEPREQPKEEPREEPREEGRAARGAQGRAARGAQGRAARGAQGRARAIPREGAAARVHRVDEVRHLHGAPGRKDRRRRFGGGQ